MCAFLPVRAWRVRAGLLRHSCSRRLLSSSTIVSMSLVRRVSVPSSLQSALQYVVLSDLHVRRETAAVCVEVLRRAHAEAAARNAGILFLGDFWHARGALPVEPLTAVLRELESWTQPVVLLPGNHDLVSRTGEGDALTPLATTLGRTGCVLISTPAVLLDALFVPYLHSTSQMRLVLKEAASLDVSAIFCHAEVSGARLAHSVIATASSRNVDPTDFPRNVRVYSGHLHKPHTVPNSSVRYVGSPYQVSAAETGQEKALLVLDRSQGWSVVETIPLDVGPRHFQVSFPSEQSALLSQLYRAGDRIVVNAQDVRSLEMLSCVSELRRHGVSVTVQQDIERDLSLHPGNETYTSPAPRLASAGLSPQVIFEKYCRLKDVRESAALLGGEIIKEMEANASVSAGSMIGKDVEIKWDSVRMRGFGSFFDEVEYPLRDRGVVLVIGQQSANAEGLESGRTNGTGKTTLVMAPLWALSGRTDPRPEGTTDRGIAAEMVHDDANSCFVTVKLRLLGARVHTILKRIMSDSEWQQGFPELGETEGMLQPQEMKDGVEKPAVDVVVTRTSAKQRTTRKDRPGMSYKQDLHLTVNGVDLTCIEVKETQGRIDNLLDTALLPHTTFFGQHTGVGRGLLESTDRALKDYLALVVPLDMWADVRGITRDKTAVATRQLEETKAAGLAAEDLARRLAISFENARKNEREFEGMRERNISELQKNIDDIIVAKVGKKDQAVLDSAFNEVEKALREVELRLAKHANDQVQRVDVAFEQSRAKLEQAERNQSWIERLVADCRAWCDGNKGRMEALQGDLDRANTSLGEFPDMHKLEGDLREIFERMKETGATFNRLVGITSPQNAVAVDEFRDAANEVIKLTHEEREELQNVSSSEASLLNIRGRLESSKSVKLKRVGSSSTFEGHAAGSEKGIGGMGTVVCDQCLRPFEEDLYKKARSALQAEEAAMKDAWESAKRGHGLTKKRLQQKHHSLMQAIEKKREQAQTNSRVLGQKRDELQQKIEARRRLSENAAALSARLQELETEARKRRREILQLINADKIEVPEDGMSESEIDGALQKARDSVQAAHEAFSLAVIAKRDAEEAAKARQESIDEDNATRRVLLEQREGFKKALAETHAIQTKMKHASAERNPHSAAVETLAKEMSTEKQAAEKRGAEARRLQHAVEDGKVLDVAFGPRGVQSFVLEDGLLSLERRTQMYLQHLSEGELRLQLRAFSKYKSTSRNGDVSETISKRIMMRREKGGETERELRQLSGGQRRRCSLAFALGFADLAAERAGFTSSLIVLDEVLQFLDAEGRRRVARALPALLTEGRESILVVAQDEAPEIAGVAHGGVDVVTRTNECSKVSVDASVPQPPADDPYEEARRESPVE